MNTLSHALKLLARHMCAIYKRVRCAPFDFGILAQSDIPEDIQSMEYLGLQTACHSNKCRRGTNSALPKLVPDHLESTTYVILLRWRWNLHPPLVLYKYLTNLALSHNLVPSILKEYVDK